MVISLAILCPESDQDEKTLGHWATSFLSSIASDSRFSVTCDLRGSAIVRTALPHHLGSVDVVIYFGHGTPSELGIPTVIDAAEGPLLAGKIVAGVACEAASTLGPDLVNTYGVSGFLGFDDLLIVVTNYPSVYAAVMDATLQTLIDVSRGGADAVSVANRDFRAVRAHYRTIADDPTRPSKDRENATFLWMGAHANARTIVWCAPTSSSSGGAGGGTGSASIDNVTISFDVDGMWIGDQFLPFSDE